MGFAIGQKAKKSAPETRYIDGFALTLPRRVWDKITVTEGCWTWTGAGSGGSDPYGVTWDGERRVKAHRLTYEAAYGPIGEGLVLDHLCRTHLCVNPTHLEPVTNAENVMRGNAPGPLATRTNRCKRGHEYTPENTKNRSDGYRECRTCMREASRRYKAARKEAAA